MLFTCIECMFFHSVSIDELKQTRRRLRHRTGEMYRRKMWAYNCRDRQTETYRQKKKNRNRQRNRQIDRDRQT